MTRNAPSWTEPWDALARQSQRAHIGAVGCCRLRIAPQPAFSSSCKPDPTMARVEGWELFEGNLKTYGWRLGIFVSANGDR
jgi:hypothetical protein